MDHQREEGQQMRVLGAALPDRDQRGPGGRAAGRGRHRGHPRGHRGGRQEV